MTGRAGESGTRADRTRTSQVAAPGVAAGPPPEPKGARTLRDGERTVLGFDLWGGPRRSPTAADDDDGGSPASYGTLLGEILEVLEVGRDRYFLIDSRHWTFGSRRLVPTWAIATIDLSDRVCRTQLPLDTIRRAPDFDPFKLADHRYHAVLRNVFGDGP